MPDDETKSDAEEVADGAAYIGVAPEYQNGAYEQNRPYPSEDGVEKAREDAALEHEEKMSKGVGIHGYTPSTTVGAQPGTEDETEGAGREIVFDMDAPEMQLGGGPLEDEALETFAQEQQEAAEGEEEEAPAPAPTATATKSKSSGGGSGGKTSVVPPE